MRRIGLKLAAGVSRGCHTSGLSGCEQVVQTQSMIAALLDVGFELELLCDCKFSIDLTSF